MHPDATRLFALEETLHAEAERMLADSGIGAILAEYGYLPVGSYAMRTMTWRDLDFEKIEDLPPSGVKWDFGTRLAATGWCVRLQYEDFYRQRLLDEGIGYGLYWAARVLDPGTDKEIARGSAQVWKLDMWSAPASAWATVRSQRDEWRPLINDESRSHILAIKEAVCHDYEYRKTMLSVHIYDAVLKHGIRDLESFRRWWQETIRAEPG